MNVFMNVMMIVLYILFAGLAVELGVAWFNRDKIRKNLSEAWAKIEAEEEEKKNRDE